MVRSRSKKIILFKNIKIVKINNPLDIRKWKRVNKIKARKILNLDLKKKIFLFISTNGIVDTRKGFEFVDKALKKMSNNSNDLLLLIVGHKTEVGKRPYQIKFIDDVNSGDVNKLKIIYSCADLLLVPSINEAQGQVSVESLSCGVPVVSFDKTGSSDIIQHKKNGYLCDYLNQDDFINFPI